ncbi:MAG: hypothetical protein JWP29_3321, partial [Rhodoferax sp.]|nr:hypothetical protein [Rhodoferax sp.]
MTLADLGAEVTKIERPGTGDTIRLGAPFYQQGAERVGIYFANVNRNKKSLALDLKSEAGRAELLAMAEHADVVVENFRAGTADRLGIGYAQLRERNPKLVYCAITGFGQTGDMARLSGHDLNIAGLAGMLQRHVDEVPHMPVVLMADYAGGTAALAAILAGVVAARTTGIGSCIDIAMLDALSSWTGVHMTQVFADREAGAARVEGWGGNPRYGLYRTRDQRYMTVSLLERDLWVTFCRAFARDDLINPHETEADRLGTHGERSEDYRRFIAEVIASDDRDPLAARFLALGLPVCPVYTPAEWAGSAPARQRACFQAQTLPELGRAVPQLGFPFHMRMADGSDAFALRLP